MKVYAVISFTGSHWLWKLSLVLNDISNINVKTGLHGFKIQIILGTVL